VQLKRPELTTQSLPPPIKGLFKDHRKEKTRTETPFISHPQAISLMMVNHDGEAGSNSCALPLNGTRQVRL